MQTIPPPPPFCSGVGGQCMISIIDVPGQPPDVRVSSFLARVDMPGRYRTRRPTRAIKDARPPTAREICFPPAARQSAPSSLSSLSSLLPPSTPSSQAASPGGQAVNLVDAQAAEISLRGGILRRNNLCKYCGGVISGAGEI